MVAGSGLRRWREGYFRRAGAESIELDRAGSLVEMFRGGYSFPCRPEDVPPLSDPTAVDVLVPHFWVQERMPIATQQPDSHTLTSTRRSLFTLRDDVGTEGARFRLDNVVDALGEVPGEWVLDRSHGRVLYAPGEGDDLATFVAVVPTVTRLVELRGRAGAPVTDVHFAGIEFTHAAATRLGEEWKVVHPALARDDFAACPQAECGISAAVELSHAQDVTLTDCAITQVDGYGVYAREGVRGLKVVGCRLTELGAGGVHLDGAPASLATRDDPAASSGNSVTDCEIGPGGLVHPGGVGVLIRDSNDNLVAHNDIHDLGYSGISVGWVWGYSPSASFNNLIEHNHIHHIGTGLMSDLGGIYLLGVAPGTEVRGNLVHDVACANYGAWGIYLDEGSSHVLVVGNVVHTTSTQAFHQHFGRENVIRGNVFAFSQRGQWSVTRAEDHLSLTFERNLVVSDGTPAVIGRDEGWPAKLKVISDLNQLWDVAGMPVKAGVGRPDRVIPGDPFRSVEEQWAAAGQDRHSAVKDPGLRIRADGSVWADGELCEYITLPDLSQVGPRPAAGV